MVKLLRVLERFLYQKAKKIVVLHPKASDYIGGLGIPDNKIVYIPQGVSPELFSSTGVKMPQELDEIISSLKSKGKLLVGYTGADGIADALGTIIEAARLLQDEGVSKVHFLMVGDGPEKGKLMRKAKSWGLSNISFFEPIPKYTMPTLLRAINITVITKKKSDLYKYGISFLKLFDYMASAKPIVWTRNSINNPVAEANCGITVPPEDPEQMAKAIMELCDLGDDERQEMGMKGQEYIRRYHSVPILANRLLEAVKDVKLG